MHKSKENHNKNKRLPRTHVDKGFKVHIIVQLW